MDQVVVKEAGDMFLAIATDVQIEAILDVASVRPAEDHARLVHFASVCEAASKPNVGSRECLRRDWFRCSSHVRDALVAWRVGLDNASKLHYLLDDVEGVLSEICRCLSSRPSDSQLHMDRLCLMQLRESTKFAALNTVRRVLATTDADKAVQVTASRAAADLASASSSSASG